MQLAYSSKGLIENQPMSDYSNANITKNKAKRAQRLFLLLFSFKGIFNMVKEALFLWIDF